MEDTKKTKKSDLRNKLFEEMVEWLEKHDGKKPRAGIYKEAKILSRKEMTEEERYEVNLYLRWYSSKLKMALDLCVGVEIEDIPDKFEEYKEKIKILRSYGLGINETLADKETTIYEEMIKWLDEHDGKEPRQSICKNGKRLSRKKMTEQEQHEVKLQYMWYKCKEREILEEYEGRTIEEVPEEYREKIATLRNYGLGIDKTLADKQKEKQDAMKQNAEAKELCRQYEQMLSEAEKDSQDVE